MYDLRIKNGLVVDGSGAGPFKANVAVLDDYIAGISHGTTVESGKIIDASGRIICPGFFDMHAHSDLYLLGNPKHEAKIMQGITTELIGVDGLSYAPLSQEKLQQVRKYISGLNGNPAIEYDWESIADFLSRFDKKVSCNVAYLVPHNAVRISSIGWADRAATKREMEVMKDLLKEGLKDGAFGFSSGLSYVPCRYCSTEELIELCAAAASYGGIYVVHLRRHLGDKVRDPMLEAFEIGRKSGIPVHISHLRTFSALDRGKSPMILEMIDEQRARGVDVTFDSHPYVGTNTMMAMKIPPILHDSGPDALLERLRNPEHRPHIKSLIANSGAYLPTHQVWDVAFISGVGSEKNRNLEGKTVSEIASSLRKDPVDVVCDLLVEEKLAVSELSMIGYEEDIEEISKHPVGMYCSDGLLLGRKTHPRTYGAFPRILGRFVRQNKWMSWEEAIRKMTSASAKRLGLTDRGLIKEGFKADIVVFDPESIIDKATFENPCQYPEGIDYVIVNGKIIVDHGKHTGVFAGRALRKGR